MNEEANVCLSLENPASLPVVTLIFQEFCDFNYCIVSSHPHKYAVIYQIIGPLKLMM